MNKNFINVLLILVVLMMLNGCLKEINGSDGLLLTPSPIPTLSPTPTPTPVKIISPTPVIETVINDYLNEGNALLTDYLNKNELSVEKLRVIIQEYDKAIEIDPECAEAYFGKGKAHYLFGESDMALQAFDKAIELKPEWAEAYFERGRTYLSNFQSEEAIKDFDKAIELKPDYAEAYFEKAWWLEGKDEEKYLVDAVQNLNEAIKIKPDYSDAYFIKGVALRELNKYEDSIQALNKAIELDPQNSNAYINKSRSLQGLSKYDEAIQTLDEALEVIRFENKSSLYYEKAKIYAVINDSTNAIKNLSECLNLNPVYWRSVGGEDSFDSIRDLEEFKKLKGEE